MSLAQIAQGQGGVGIAGAASPEDSGRGGVADDCFQGRPGLGGLRKRDRRSPMPLTPCSNAKAPSHRWIRALDPPNWTESRAFVLRFSLVE